MTEKYICHDCQKEMRENEEYMEYKTEDGNFLKCKSCHQKDPALRNYQKTEVYSRIVGYIRPVGQWNAGKAEEYKDRKEYKSSCGCCSDSKNKKDSGAISVNQGGYCPCF